MKIHAVFANVFEAYVAVLTSANSLLFFPYFINGSTHGTSTSIIIISSFSHEKS